MGSRARVAAIFAVLIAAVGGWLWLSARESGGADPTARSVDAGTEPGRAGPLAAVPRGALLLATVDVGMLRRTSLGERLIGRGRRAGGLGPVADLCGSDPMAGVDQLVLAIPAAGTDAAFAVFAAGAVDADALLRCAAQVIRRRGGQPVASPMGRFRVLRDASLLEPGAELAVAPGGPVVLAQGSYLRRAIDTADGRLPSIQSSAAHGELRRAVGDGVIAITVVLTPELRRTLAQELAAQGAAQSPVAALVSAGMSLQVGERLDGRWVLRCDRPEPCRELAELLDEVRQQRVQAIARQSPALGEVLRTAVIRAAGDAVHVAASVPADRGLDLLDGLLALWGAGGAPAVGDDSGPRSGASVDAVGSGAPRGAGVAPPASSQPSAPAGRGARRTVDAGSSIFDRR